jgi:hypothetical protein
MEAAESCKKSALLGQASLHYITDDSTVINLLATDFFF